MSERRLLLLLLLLLPNSPDVGQLQIFGQNVRDIHNERQASNTTAATVRSRQATRSKSVP